MCRTGFVSQHRKNKNRKTSLSQAECKYAKKKKRGLHEQSGAAACVCVPLLCNGVIGKVLFSLRPFSLSFNKFLCSNLVVQVLGILLLISPRSFFVTAVCELHLSLFS